MDLDVKDIVVCDVCVLPLVGCAQKNCLYINWR